MTWSQRSPRFSQSVRNGDSPTTLTRAATPHGGAPGSATRPLLLGCAQVVAAWPPAGPSPAPAASRCARQGRVSRRAAASSASPPVLGDRHELAEGGLELLVGRVPDPRAQHLEDLRLRAPVHED